MRTRLESLFAAQQKLLRSSTLPQERQVVLDALQAQIPAPALAHFLRLIAQGRKGVGLVQHGVCSGCHLRLPAGTASLLAKSDDLHLCENCGCYL
ncbi:MAG TPA: C4-type zinc ribbon domain-containing protein, partial [Opitutus sp.]|nr:C4-type zinc ribbon domain-containing protein [Opitutus sp.]